MATGAEAGRVEEDATKDRAEGVQIAPKKQNERCSINMGWTHYLTRKNPIAQINELVDSVNELVDSVNELVDSV